MTVDLPAKIEPFNSKLLMKSAYGMYLLVLVSMAMNASGNACFEKFSFVNSNDGFSDLTIVG